MQFFDNIKAKAEATRAGRAKAERDIDLSNQFIDVHEGKPDYAIMRKFFNSLGDDVRPGPEAESYMKVIRKHQDYVREGGLIEPQNIPNLGVIIPLKDGVPDLSTLPAGMPAELVAAITGALADLAQREGPSMEAIVENLWAQNPTMTAEDVDEIAADHGHNTRDDECEGLQILRQKIADRDAKK